MIKEYGLLWRASLIDWNQKNNILLGRAGQLTTDLADERGLYILYGADGPMYVGIACEAGMGNRLRHHYHHKFKKYKDEPEKWWDRFSWFGFRSVSDNQPSLAPMPTTLSVNAVQAIKDLEALIMMVLPLNNVRPQKLAGARKWTQAES